MGQVIAFPRQQRREAHVRLSTAVNALCVMTYMLGFFIAAPMLAMFAIGFTFTARPVAALACAAALAIVCGLTRAAYTRL
jgi:hypothetical protein